jgi:hypothetical protein
MDFVELIKEQKMSIEELLLDTGKSLENEMTPFEKNCYGMTESDIREQYMNSLTARMSGLEMVCMSILSDAQELLAMGATNDSRQYMNRAKFILSEMMEEKREVA